MTLTELGKTVMTFGMYGPKHSQGPQRFDEIPLHYLEWALENNVCRGILGEKLEAYMKHPRTCQEIDKANR